MPTIFQKDGFRFFFYSADGAEPIHIHVEHGEGIAKFWLSPLRMVYAYRLKAQELKKARVLIEENVELIEGKWNEYFSPSRK